MLCPRPVQRAWESAGRWLPFPARSQLPVAMAPVCFHFLQPRHKRKARASGCLLVFELRDGPGRAHLPHCAQGPSEVCCAPPGWVSALHQVPSPQVSLHTLLRILLLTCTCCLPRLTKPSWGCGQGSCTWEKSPSTSNVAHHSQATGSARREGPCAPLCCQAPLPSVFCCCLLFLF